MTKVPTPKLTKSELDKAYETGVVSTYACVRQGKRADIVRVDVALELYQDLQKSPARQEPT